MYIYIIRIIHIYIYTCIIHIYIYMSYNILHIIHTCIHTYKSRGNLEETGSLNQVACWQLKVLFALEHVIIHQPRLPLKVRTKADGLRG